MLITSLFHRLKKVEKKISVNTKVMQIYLSKLHYTVVKGVYFELAYTQLLPIFLSLDLLKSPGLEEYNY